MSGLARVGIHASVGDVFPSELLVEALTDIEPTVAVVESAAVETCDALVTFAYDDAFLDGGLGWIHSIQAGVDRFPFAALEDRGIALTNSTGIHGDLIGETVAGYMLAFARQLHRYRANQVAGEWRQRPWDAAFTLDGSSVCVVGLGTLGRGVAVRAAALGMAVTGVKRTPTPVDFVDTVYPAGDLQEAIADSRFVVLTVPLTDRTEGLIGAEELATMRDDAILINVARGPVVDEAALIEALERDEIAGAALDVFETEPLPADSPLWEMDDIIVTPHAAGVAESYYERIAALVRENARRYDADEPLANRVV